MQYPQNITNRIQYTYGDADATDNRVGRVTLVQDASGGTEFFYGKLGETTKIVRTLMLSTADVRTYVSEVKYDSWNRIRQMKYPDGETVTYGYDGAGQLKTMISEKDGNTYRLIDDMRYNLYGNVTYKKYGNGTESRYIYDPLRQRLTSLSVQSAQGNILDAAYSYDKIDNILGITNRANPSGELGGTYSHSYSYDAFSRLTQASGECSKGVNYTLAMQYDVMSNPLRKTQNVTGSTLAQSTDFTYLYTNQQPNAVKQIGNTSYSYDLNGNPTLVEGDTVYREMIWNEENRLMLLSDDGEVTRYTYDYAGNCAIKSHGPMTSVYINGALQGVDYHDDSDYTLYVSPFMTVNADRFTKYYYVGTQRIAGKIGNGKFENIYGEDGFHLNAGQKDYAQRAVNMLEDLQAYYKQTGVTPGVPNQLGKTADPYVSGTAYPSVALGNCDVPEGWPGKVVKHGKGEVPGPPVWFEEENVQEAVAGVGYQSDNQRENDIFFYHTDHLQSTTYLTDSVGNVSQFVWYAPYGEALIDEHVGSYENPYKFSGKELDENTGLYDHGARHREPMICGWYGVDPLFEKFPEVSPYHYCHANPVRLMDLNGMCDTVFFTANVNFSFGSQLGIKVKNRYRLVLNLASIDIYDAQYREDSENLGGVSESHLIFEDGYATVRQGISVGASAPVVGEVALSAGQSFKVYNGYTEQTEDDLIYPNADVDVAKLSFSIKFLLGIDLDMNWNFTNENTFVYIYKLIKDYLTGNETK